MKEEHSARAAVWQTPKFLLVVYSLPVFAGLCGVSLCYQVPLDFIERAIDSHVNQAEGLGSIGYQMYTTNLNHIASLMHTAPNKLGTCDCFPGNSSQSRRWRLASPMSSSASLSGDAWLCQPKVKWKTVTRP